MSEAVTATRTSVTVVALGDIGRSPRTTNHALSFAGAGSDVDLVAYVETEVPASLTEHPRIRLHVLQPLSPRWMRGLPRWSYLPAAVWRTKTQAFFLLWTLLVRVRRPATVLLQVPPAIPSMFVCWVACRLRGALLVIDWHNLGYRVMQLRLGDGHLAVRAARAHERWMADRADRHLCVSAAFREWLSGHWGLDAVVAADLPSERFRREQVERSVMRERFAARLEPAEGAEAAATVDDGPRPLLVCPTSWTADDDFELLLSGLELYDRARALRAASRSDPDGLLPALLVALTGRGPLREAFERRLDRRPMPAAVTIRTLWLAGSDYPAFLRAADLGLSVHRSASGLDIPIKVVDLLGARVPVCALDYGAALSEALDPGRNSLLFKDADQLAERLIELFSGHPNATLAKLQQFVDTGPQPRSWEDDWLATVGPVVLGSSTASAAGADSADRADAADQP